MAIGTSHSAHTQSFSCPSHTTQATDTVKDIKAEAVMSEQDRMFTAQDECSSPCVCNNSAKPFCKGSELCNNTRSRNMLDKYDVELPKVCVYVS